MRKLATLTALLFVVLTSSLWADFNLSSGFLLEPIQRDTEVEFNYYHEDNSPASILWDINADGTYDTTTTEQTLIYDYGAYDTTQVIAKAIFDSLTYDMDTVSIALFDNRLPVTYDTMWVCTLETANYLVQDISPDGNTVIVTKYNSGIPKTCIIKTGEIISEHDSTTGGWVLNNDGECLLTQYGYDSEYREEFISGLVYVDSNEVLINNSVIYGEIFVAENGEYFMDYSGETSNSIFYTGGMDVNPCYLDIMSKDFTFKNYIRNKSGSSFSEKSLDYQKNLNFIATLQKTKPKLTVFNKNGDTLFAKTNVYDFEPDSAKFLGSLIHVDENDYIYTLIGYSFDYFGSVSFFDNEMLHGFNLLINQYNQSGIIQETDTMTNVKTNKIMITDDAKYMLGCTENGFATKQMVCLWDFQTKELLFEHWFEDSDINTYVFCSYMYNSTSDNLITNIRYKRNRILFDKNGNQIYNQNRKINIFDKRNNYANQRDYNRFVIYRVEWEE